MLRQTAQAIGNIMRRSLPINSLSSNTIFAAGLKAHSQFEEEELEECFNERIVSELSKDGLDGWDLRQIFNDVAGMDLIIDPCIVEAGLKACRRVNDIAIAIRWLEVVRDKCADDEKSLYPCIMEQIAPTMKELGIPYLEDLCFDRPELALPSVYDM